jgi:tRNA uridine 5-carbamoylmethylation protein Kti12
MLHHNGKGNEYDRGSQHKILGSVGIQGSVGTMWILHRPDEQDRERAAIEIVSRDTDHTKPINLKWNVGRLRFTASNAEYVRQLHETEQKVYKLITDHPNGIHFQDIVETLQMSSSNLSKKISSLKAKDMITEIAGKHKQYKAFVIDEDMYW